MGRSSAVGMHPVTAIRISAALVPIAHKQRMTVPGGSAYILYRPQLYAKVTFLVSSPGQLYHHSARLHSFPIVKARDFITVV